MNILDNFGFNPMLFVAQIINFVIIFFVLKKIMFKPVMDMLKKRDTEIKKGLSNAEEGHKLLLEAEEKEKKILQKAQETSEKMISEAKIQVEDIRTQAEENTKKEIENMMTQARDTIEQESKLAEEKLTKNIGAIALGLLEKSLTGVFGRNEQKVILKKATTQLQKEL